MDAIGRRLHEAGSVVCTTHVTPDGDGLGSALALVRYLRSLGKTAVVLNCSSVPPDLRFLYRSGEFAVYHGQKHLKILKAAQAIVATDIGGASRMGKMTEPVRRTQATKVVIDHHIYDNDFFDLALIKSSASSSAEITYDFLRHLDAEITPEIAEPLYVGLVSDTGGFAYTATSSKAHLMAAELLDAGVDPYDIHRRLTCQVAFGKMRFLGLCLSRLRLEAEGRVVWTDVDLNFLRRNDTVPRDAFEVVNHLLHLKGVEAGAFFMEISNTKTKVSLRSTGLVDVCAIARRYGGGGHRFAAGCTVDGKSLQETIPVILDQLRDALPELDAEEDSQRSC